MAFERSVMLFFRVPAAQNECETLTHVVDGHKIVAVVGIVDALDTDRESAGLTEVFDRLVLMKLARDEV
jgi:hypothetical protein